MPMHQQPFVVGLFVVLCTAASISADEWTSPDSVISVARPDASRFVEIEPPAPMIAAWISNDQTTRLGITVVPAHGVSKLVRQGLEDGIKKMINGEITDSAVENVRGHVVFRITGRGNLQGNELVIAQSIVAIDNKIYKVMATAIGKDVQLDNDVREFVSSFKILKDNTGGNWAAGGNGRARADGTRAKSKPLVQELSERIGGISALLLLACLAIILLNKVAKRRR